MRNYIGLVLIMIFMNFSNNVLSDEVEQKTDGSFVGDISNSTVNDSFSGEDVRKKTDSGFAGDDAINAQNTYFAGDSYQEQVGNSTVAPFAGDHSFSGDSYGK